MRRIIARLLSALDHEWLVLAAAAVADGVPIGQALPSEGLVPGEFYEALQSPSEHSTR
jgi:hypothetical protein